MQQLDHNLIPQLSKLVLSYEVTDMVCEIKPDGVLLLDRLGNNLFYPLNLQSLRAFYTCKNYLVMLVDSGILSFRSDGRVFQLDIEGITGLNLSDDYIELKRYVGVGPKYSYELLQFPSEFPQPHDTDFRIDEDGYIWWKGKEFQYPISLTRDAVYCFYKGKLFYLQSEYLYVISNNRDYVCIETGFNTNEGVSSIQLTCSGDRILIFHQIGEAKAAKVYSLETLDEVESFQDSFVTINGDTTVASSMTSNVSQERTNAFDLVEEFSSMIITKKEGKYTPPKMVEGEGFVYGFTFQTVE